MRISYPNGIVISLTEDEAREIFFAMKDRVESSIKNYWINFPDSFLKNENGLGIIRVLCRTTKYSYESEILPIFLEMLEQTNK